MRSLNLMVVSAMATLSLALTGCSDDGGGGGGGSPDGGGNGGSINVESACGEVLNKTIGCFTTVPQGSVDGCTTAFEDFATSECRSALGNLGDCYSNLSCNDVTSGTVCEQEQQTFDQVCNVEAGFSF